MSVCLSVFLHNCLGFPCAALLLYGASGTRKTGKIVPFLTDCLVFCLCNLLSLATVLCVGKPFMDSLVAFFSLRCSVMAGATDAPLEQGRINQLSVH